MKLNSHNHKLLGYNNDSFKLSTEISNPKLKLFMGKDPLPESYSNTLQRN